MTGATKATLPGLVGPTLSDSDSLQLSGQMPACGTCPKAMWYRTSKHLRAFCREIRLITWEQGEQDPILQCDGRDAALMASVEPEG